MGIRCFFLERLGKFNSEGQSLFRRTDTGEKMTLSAAPVGAMWFADWYLPSFKGPDGHVLVVRTPPDHDWIVDSRCSNCSLPDDNDHYCWVRHGVPPDITVDKNGRTCSAGAGSLGVWNKDKTGYVWHGFLRNGYLVEA